MSRWVVLPGAVGAGAQQETLVAALSGALGEEPALAGGTWTVLGSGDVVVDGEVDPGTVARSVDAVVLRALGAEAAASPALVRTSAQWREVMRNSPFAPGATGTQQVLFVRDLPEPRLRRALVGRDWGGDQVVVRGREVYLRYAGSVEGSLARHATVLRYLDAVGTARGWADVRATAEVLAGALV
ncbi:DUF1697 domain-containing protein [Promicromonospora citrea]|uniref:DUF1697 domain-containing protein n=1 Tax=Promicromonospora citrea TaxID=43677 RepID=UPI001489228F|nr:DUF1697 domain-containing protein [Promicromonospora citrea]NNH50969.1 DUF1697 domain-containing protein [Promicromonospora citrea]